MRRIDIPYGRGVMPVDVDEASLAGVLVARDWATATDEAAVVRAALDAPIGTPPLRELARGKRRVLVITSDHTRPMPSAITLPMLLADIRTASPLADVRILIATGTHRPMTQDEMRARFGDAIVDGETLICHDCADRTAMIRMGTLPSGGALWLNSLIGWADLVISEGFIEPHFFAGFSGGRKSVLPGIASRETILYNHNAQFIRDPRARQGCLNGNPLHRDMRHAARVAGLSLILNVLLNDEKRIIDAYAGDPETAHRRGCKACLTRVKVDRVRADIVVTSNGGYPLDQNVYQCVKGMATAETCVRPGGVIIQCAALGDGAGGEAFYRWLADAPHPRAVAELIEGIAPEDTREDQWEAQILARVLLHATVIFVTGEENRSIVEAMHMRWAPDANEAMRLAVELAGERPRVTVIPDGVGVIVR